VLTDYSRTQTFSGNGRLGEASRFDEERFRPMVRPGEDVEFATGDGL
jgi:hypothetical protein